MLYYKIISQNEVVGVGVGFLKWNSKMHRFYYSEIDFAHCVQDSITLKKYTTEWLKPLPADAPQIEEAKVVVIDETEYNELYEQLKEEEVIPYTPPTPSQEEKAETQDNVIPEQPLTIQQMREKLKKQDETINMLVDCLLEVSEVVYNE